MMMVAFDTNIFMGQAKDRLLVIECINCWTVQNEPVRLLMPRVRHLGVPPHAGNRAPCQASLIRLKTVHAWACSSVCVSNVSHGVLAFSRNMCGDCISECVRRLS